MNNLIGFFGIRKMDRRLMDELETCELGRTGLIQRIVESIPRQLGGIERMLKRYIMGSVQGGGLDMETM